MCIISAPLVLLLACVCVFSFFFFYCGLFVYGAVSMRTLSGVWCDGPSTMSSLIRVRKRSPRSPVKCSFALFVRVTCVVSGVGYAILSAGVQCNEVGHCSRSQFHFLLPLCAGPCGPSPFPTGSRAEGLREIGVWWVWPWFRIGMSSSSP